MTQQAHNRRLKTTVGRVFQAYGLALMIAIMVIVFAALNENFLTLSNFQNILEQNAALMIVAVGVTFAFLSMAIVWPVMVIGLITFGTSFIGVFI